MPNLQNTVFCAINVLIGANEFKVCAILVELCTTRPREFCIDEKTKAFLHRVLFPAIDPGCEVVGSDRIKKSSHKARRVIAAVKCAMFALGSSSDERPSSLLKTTSCAAICFT